MLNIRHRLLSVFMAVIFTLTSVSFIVQTETPITAHAMANNNMVSGTQDYVELSGINPDDNEAVPEYQMMRFSLIDVGESTTNPGGFIHEGDGVVNNPISVWNSNSDGPKDFRNVESYNRILQITNPSDDRSPNSYEVGNVLNTRRDYTSQNPMKILYSTKNVTIYDRNPDFEHGEDWDDVPSHVEVVGYYGADYVKILEDDSIPQVIAGSSVESKYQKKPPEGYEYWSSLSDSDFFYEYTQTAFIPADAPSFVTQPVPDFIYRIIALMCGYDSPYVDEATYNEVASVYKSLVADGKCKILVEPLQVFKNTGDGSVVDTFFGPDAQYVALSCAEISAVDDNASGVNYGFTDQTHCMNIEKPELNDYNFFTGEGSPTQGDCNNLFVSLLLDSSEWQCALKSLFDDGSYGNASGLDAYTQFQNYFESSNENFMTGSVKADSSAYGAAIQKTSNKDDPDAVPYWNNIFYYQVFEDIYKDKDFNTTEAMAHTLHGADPASMMTFGGMAIITGIYSSLDIETNLVGVGTPEDEFVNDLLVYPDSYATNSDGSGTLTISGSMQLNFDDDATSWNEEIVTHINNGDPSGTLNETYDPNYTSFTCAAVNDSNEASSTGSHLRYVHSIDDTSNNYGDTAGDVYIPANVVLHIEITYADENGEPLSVEDYYQIDGTQAKEAGELIHLSLWTYSVLYSTLVCTGVKIGFLSFSI